MSKSIFNFRASGKPISGGFTLVELLVVIAIIAILTFLAIPAIQAMQKSGGFAKAVYDQSDALNLARSYALANNTYVYVGLAELDRAQLSTAVPQAAGVGKIAMVTVAAKDGTNDTTSTNLTQVRPVQVFDGLHVATQRFGQGTGTMARPTATSNSSIFLGEVSYIPKTSFSIPLSGSGKYNFNAAGTSWVVCFNPQGGILTTDSSDTLSTAQFIEIDLQPVGGGTVPTLPIDVNKGNQAALVIDGATGATTVYRP